MTGNDPADSSPTGYVTWNPIERNWHLRVPWRAGLPRADSSPARCPFCPGGPEALKIDRPQVVASKFPFVPPPADASFEPHRVLFFSRDHSRNLDDLGAPAIAEVFHVLSAQRSDLLTHSCVQSVCILQAFGPVFGGSVSHPHLQIVGLPCVPTKMAPDAAHGCPLCGVFEQRECLIAETDDFILAVPPWSRVAYEMLITSRHHLESMDDLESGQVATLLCRSLTACSRLTDGQSTPYILNVMTAPTESSDRHGDGLAEHHHFRIEILPFCTETGQVRAVSAMELGMGVSVNPILPGSAASRLRQV